MPLFIPIIMSICITSNAPLIKTSQNEALEKFNEYFSSISIAECSLFRKETL